MTGDLHRQQMKSLLESGQFSDVTLLVGSPEQEEMKEFKVHRSLLSAFSPVFSAMFGHSDTKEVLEKRVVIEDVSAEGIHHMLTFIYTGELKFEEEGKMKSLLEFLAVVDKYQLDTLKANCESRLKHLITLDSVCKILEFADFYNALDLKEHCLCFIVKYSDRVISRDSASAWQQFEGVVRPELIKDIFYRVAARENVSSSSEHVDMTDVFHCQQMKSLLESGQFSDVTLVVGREKKEFKAHRNLLSAFSPVFSTMFGHTDTKEALEKRVVIPDVSSNMMDSLLTFFYTGELKLKKGKGKKEKVKFFLKFLAVIDKYQVDSLKGECESRLTNLVTINTVCDILRSADLYNSSQLSERCLSFIVKNSDQVISRDSASWQQFEEAARPELIKDILYRLASWPKAERSVTSS